MGEGGERQAHFGAAAGVEHEAKVLDEDVDRAGHGRVVVDHARAAVFQHPRRSATARQERQGLFRIDALSLGEGEALGSNGDMHAAQQLVDDLHRRALSGRFAEMKQIAAESAQRRLLGSKDSPRCRGHDGQRARIHPGDPARDRRIDEAAARRRHALGHGGDTRRRAGGHDDDGRIGGESCNTAHVEQHVVGLIGVDGHDDQGARTPAGVCDRRRCVTTGGDEPLHRLGLHVVADHPALGLDEAARHGGAHGAEADEGDAGRLGRHGDSGRDDLDCNIRLAAISANEKAPAGVCGGLSWR